MARRLPKIAKSGRKMETRKRAVLQFRVHQDDYDELAKAAKAQKLTISEEAARRLRGYREADASERLLDWFLLQEKAEVELDRRGHRKLVLWMGPSETDVSVLTASQLEALLVNAAKQGAELALKNLQN